MQSQDSRICDACGSKKVGIRWQGDDLCQSCYDKRTNWDEGARFGALMLLGQAVAVARNFGAETWEIHRAVEYAVTGPTSPNDQFVGMHPDDAMGLAAHIAPGS